MLTKKQANALTFIEGYIQDQGVSPTLLEIATATGGTSEANVHRTIRCLIERGYVRRVSGQHRGIEVIKSLKARTSPVGHSCPHCGSPLSVSVAA